MSNVWAMSNYHIFQFFNKTCFQVCASYCLDKKLMIYNSWSFKWCWLLNYHFQWKMSLLFRFERCNRCMSEFENCTDYKKYRETKTEYDRRNYFNCRRCGLIKFEPYQCCKKCKNVCDQCQNYINIVLFVHKDKLNKMINKKQSGKIISSLWL